MFKLNFDELSDWGITILAVFYLVTVVGAMAAL